MNYLHDFVMRFDFYTPSEITAILGERLKKQRLLINITQSQLADKAGVGKSTIARIETGQGGTLENVIRIATALGLINELAELFEPKAHNIDEIIKHQNIPQRASGKL